MEAGEQPNVAGVLLDIEGTTSSVRFVYDIMFPMVLERLDDFLSSHWGEDGLAAACDQIARDAGQPDLEQWLGASVATSASVSGEALVAQEVRRLMADDVKATGLKQLQGMIWKDGFESGELQAHVYGDVPNALERWQAASTDIRIYSSGSIQAQKLFFGHTVAGNLLPYFSGHYDTTIGGKKDALSYERIVADWRLPAGDILFASDVVAELDAARQAGLQTLLCLRPGNAEAPANHGHTSTTTFDGV